MREDIHDTRRGGDRRSRLSDFARSSFRPRFGFLSVRIWGNASFATTATRRPWPISPNDPSVNRICHRAAWNRSFGRRKSHRTAESVPSTTAARRPRVFPNARKAPIRDARPGPATHAASEGGTCDSVDVAEPRSLIYHRVDVPRSGRDEGHESKYPWGRLEGRTKDPAAHAPKPTSPIAFARRARGRERRGPAVTKVVEEVSGRCQHISEHRLSSSCQCIGSARWCRRARERTTTATASIQP